MVKHTVIIPTYNHIDYLPDAISSVKNSQEDVDLIIVNDGSTDKTYEYLKNLKGARVFNQTNRGAHDALNVGLENSLGSFISILNDDDTFNPNHLLQAEQLLGGKIADFVVHRANVFGSGPKYEAMQNHVEIGDRYISSFGLFASLFKFNWSLSTSSFSFTRDLIERGIRFQPLIMNHDLDFLLEALVAYNARCVYSGKATWNYRCHGSNHGDSVKAINREYELAFTLIKKLKRINGNFSKSELFNIIGYDLNLEILEEVLQFLTLDSKFESFPHLRHHISSRPN